MAGQPQNRSERAENLRVRLPRTMHQQLRQMAEDEGVTVNALLVALIADAIGFSLRPAPEADTEAS
jgi:predicted HicB family RNase H-like nuclease